MELAMFKYILPLSLLSVSMVSGSALSAALVSGGQINITGAISDTTCTINGGNSADMTILLDPISITDAGTTANTVIAKNQKTVTLTLSNCTTTATSPGNLKLHFFGSSSISSSGLYLVNDTVDETNPAVARNVGFSISTPTSPTVALTLNSPTGIDTGLASSAVSTAGGSSYSFVVSYYKTNATTATTGAVHSNVIYTVAYL